MSIMIGTRKTKLGGLTALVVALALVACGDPTATTGTSAVTTAPAAATTAPAGATTAPAAATTAPVGATTAPAMATTAAGTMMPGGTGTAGGTMMPGGTTTGTMMPGGTGTAGGTMMPGGTGTPAMIATTAPSGTQTTGTSGAVQPTSGTYSALYTADTSKKGGNLSTAMTTDIDTFHPYGGTSYTDNSVVQPMIYNGLLTRDPKTTFLVCELCQSYQVAQDFKSVTYKMRTDIKWSDGVAITAKDVEWTIKQALNPDNKWDYIDDYKDEIVSATASDDTTITISIKDARFDVLSFTGNSFIVLPQHTWEKLAWNDVKTNPEIEKPTVVSGPWKLKEWKKGDSITFVRNDASTVYPPALADQFTFQIVKDSTVIFQKLKSGEISFANSDVSGIQPVDFDGFKKAPVAGYTTQTWDPASASWTYVGFNFRRPYLKDLAVRQAISYVVDKQAVIDNTLYGLGKPLYSDIPVTDKTFYTENGVNKYGLDIAKAKSTLTAAGYKLDGTTLKDKDGKALPKLKIEYNTGNKVRETVAVYLQSQLQEIGIQADVVPLDFNAYLKQIKSEPFDYDMFILGWSASFYNQTFGDVWKAIPNLNAGNYVNESVNSDYAKVKGILDINQQIPVMQNIQKTESNDPPYLYLFSRTNYAIYGPKVVPQTATGAGSLGDHSFNFADWAVAK